MTTPIYIKVENREKILKELQDILNKTERAKTILNEIKRLRDHEESLINEWEARIANSQQKLGKVFEIMENQQ